MGSQDINELFQDNSAWLAEIIVKSLVYLIPNLYSTDFVPSIIVYFWCDRGNSKSAVYWPSYLVALRLWEFIILGFRSLWRNLFQDPVEFFFASPLDYRLNLLAYEASIVLIDLEDEPWLVIHVESFLPLLIFPLSNIHAPKFDYSVSTARH